jgi:hypothetical protein
VLDPERQDVAAQVGLDVIEQVFGVNAVRHGKAPLRARRGGLANLYA